VNASRTTARRVEDRQRAGERRRPPVAEWVDDRLVIVDFRPASRLSRARLLRRRAGLALSGLAIGGGLGLAGVAFHHLLGG
jgi:hypothetical protein